MGDEMTKYLNHTTLSVAAGVISTLFIAASASFTYLA